MDSSNETTDHKVENSRRTEINEILKLLSALTNDKSLNWLSKNSNPELILEHFRRLWISYSNPKVALKLTFGKSDEPSKIIIFDEGNIQDTECTCGNQYQSVMYCDTTDSIFFQKETDNIFMLYYCNNCVKFNVIKQDTSMSFKEFKNFNVPIGIRPIHDMEDETKLVPVVDTEECSHCTGELKIGQINTFSFKGSKISGIYAKQIRKAFPVEQKLCDHDNYETIARFSSYDIIPLRKYGVSEIRMEKCIECNIVFLNVYSQDLNIGYDTLFFTDLENYYHVITTGDMKGVILKTNPDNDILISCGMVRDLIYTENELKYTNITKLSDEQIEKLTDSLDITVNHRMTAKIITLFEKLSDQLKSVVEVKLDVIEDSKISEKYGDDFCILIKPDILKNSLVSITDDKFILYGVLRDDLSLNPFTSRQIRYIESQNYETGKIP